MRPSPKPHSFIHTSITQSTSMASIPCSFNFTSPLFSFSKSNGIQLPSCLSVSCFGSTSVKSLLGSSSSGLFQHGFALKAGIFSGFSSDSRSEFGVFATAATGKTIYNFTVKVCVPMEVANILLVDAS